MFAVSNRHEQQEYFLEFQLRFFCTGMIVYI
jgi:hypothetical protein